MISAIQYLVQPLPEGIPQSRGLHFSDAFDVVTQPLNDLGAAGANKANILGIDCHLTDCICTVGSQDGTDFTVNLEDGTHRDV
ncbi:hypothetical protein D3C75_824060 [compost metagenome]